MTEHDPIYLIYLADTDGYTATIAVFTHYSRRIDECHEVRVPSRLSLQKSNRALYALDKECPVITSQYQLDAWLDSRSGWAAFTPESAARLVPHWLGEKVEYVGAHVRAGSIEFVELSSLAVLTNSDLRFDLAGPSIDDGALEWFMQIAGNLTASRRPVCTN